MKVEYFATIREVVGKKGETIETGPVAVRELLELLCRTHEKLSEELFEGVHLKAYHKILVNGRDIRALDGLDTRVDDDDVISFFPPVGGG